MQSTAFVGDLGVRRHGLTGKQTTEQPKRNKKSGTAPSPLGDEEDPKSFHNHSYAFDDHSLRNSGVEFVNQYNQSH